MSKGSPQKRETVPVIGLESGAFLSKLGSFMFHVVL